MNLYEALYTTRSMRRLRPDPIPYEAQARILDAAIRAPNPGNAQKWRFLLVDDPAIKRQLASFYQESQALGLASFYGEQAAATGRTLEEVERENADKLRSARHLAEHWAEVPLFLFGFSQDDPAGKEMIFALWSAMLAARGEGIGSTYTTLLSLFKADETLDILEVPKDEGWTMAACIAMGYPTGKWSVASRKLVDDVAARNTWRGSLGFTVPEPLWDGGRKTEDGRRIVLAD
jgi:nitroreductase